MKISLEEKKIEALKRMQTICDAFGLGNKLVNYLKEDRLYYSYVYSMDTINYDPRYAAKVKEFEEKYNAYVYHVVEAKTRSGIVLLSFLYVSDEKEEWPIEQLEVNGGIFTFTCPIGNADDGEMAFYEEFGWIRMSAPMGYLARIA